MIVKNSSPLPLNDQITAFRRSWQRETHTSWTQQNWSHILFTNNTQAFSRTVWRSHSGDRMENAIILPTYGKTTVFIWLRNPSLALCWTAEHQCRFSIIVTAQWYKNEVLEPHVTFVGSCKFRLRILGYKELVDSFLEGEDIHHMDWPASIKLVRTFIIEMR